MPPAPPAPMKAVAGDLPTGDRWVYELKWDGMRCLIRVADGDVRVFSSNGNDVTARYPELDGLPAALGVDAVLDAEAVAFGDDGRPSFGRLQQRMHLTSASEAQRRRRDVPVVFAVFDVLEVAGRSTTSLPWRQRRELLEQLFEPGPHWRLSDVHHDGQALFDAAVAQRLEGVMAKRTDRHYQPGKRSPDWVKVKVRRRQEFVIGGWARGNGARAGELASLAVGVFDDGNFRFAGRVGSGISSATAVELEALMATTSRPTCPFSPAPTSAMHDEMHWVDPTLVVEVAFAEWTDDGRLRHPAYVGRRTDVEATAVVREP